MNIKSTPLISICIPSYKNPELFERCLKSVIEQTYTNTEIIITDDSPDTIIEEIVKVFFKDSRVRYFKNAPSLGSPENWNAGLSRSTGEYIKIMHHDDWFAFPQALEIFVDEAIKSNADFICSYCNNVFPDKKIKHKILKRFRTKWAKDKSLILYANYIGNPSTILFRKTKNNSVMYDSNSIWFVDMLFYFEFVQLFPKVAYIEKFLIDTSAGLETQITNSSANAKIRIMEFMYIAKKHELNRKNSLLTKVSFLEILKRYGIRSEADFERITQSRMSIPFSKTLLNLPIHHQIYNVLKHLLILI